MNHVYIFHVHLVQVITYFSQFYIHLCKHVTVCVCSNYLSLGEVMSFESKAFAEQLLKVSILHAWISASLSKLTYLIENSRVKEWKKKRITLTKFFNLSHRLVKYYQQNINVRFGKEILEISLNYLPKFWWIGVEVSSW